MTDSPNRIIDLDAGVAMVVTDLHGSWPVYASLRDRFLALRTSGEAHRLIFCGDLIHAEDDANTDGSLDILLDVMRLQDELGPQHIAMLLGNHELPHIYGIGLARGNRDYTPGFERALALLGARRQAVIDFLSDLPLYARTPAGVLLSHAGAAAGITSLHDVQRLLAIDHRAMLADARRQLAAFGIEDARREYERAAGIRYASQAQQRLAVSGPNDPRYNDLLVGYLVSSAHPDFELLWQALFTRNEYDSSLATYTLIVSGFLENVSALSPMPQRVLVGGHLGAPGGYRLVGTQQLRLASYTHARPRSSGKYLLLDCQREVHSAQDLVLGLRPTFE